MRVALERIIMSFAVLLVSVTSIHLAAISVLESNTPNPLTDAFAHHLAVVIELSGSVTSATFPLAQTVTFSSLCFLLTSWSTLT